jgi:hypothetical protein
MILLFGAITSCKTAWLYYPDHNTYSLPVSCGITYEDVHFKASDGTVLCGWYAFAPQNRGTILYCHGNAGNISWFVENYRIFKELGFNVFVFDYRGYGSSEGVPSVEGTFSDVEGAWNYLVSERKIKPSSIVVWGRSMGGPIAAYCASNHKPGAFVAESTFTSLWNVVNDFCCVFPYVVWPVHDYMTIEYVRKIESPVLVIHSINDSTIPYHQGRELYDAVKAKKSFLDIQGSHNGGFFFSRDLYIKGIDDFMKQYFDKKPGD